MPRKQALTRPVTDQTCERVEVVVKAALHRRRKQVSIFDDASHLHVLPVQPCQVCGVAKVMSERFYGGARRARKIRILLQLRPAREDFTAFLHANTIPDVITQNDVESRQQDLQQKVRQSAKVCRWRRNDNLVVDVSVDHELVRCIALIKLDGIKRPLREFWPGSALGGHSSGSDHQACSFCAIDLWRP